MSRVSGGRLLHRGAGAIPRTGKAKAIGDTRGKIKVVVNAENDEILGFHTKWSAVLTLITRLGRRVNATPLRSVAYYQPFSD